MIFIWIITWRKRAIVFLLLSLFFFIPSQRILNYHPKENNTGNLKVITFNTKNGSYDTSSSKTPVADYIEKHNPDIVLVQENHQGLGEGDSVKSPVIQLSTKHKILDRKHLINDNSNGHSFYADIEVRGKIVRVINVYLQPFQLQKSMVKPTLDAAADQAKAKKLIFRLVPTFKAHVNQVHQIREAVESSPYPVILAGDFNSVPNSWEYFNLVKGLKDPFLEVGHGLGTSFHDYKFPIRIDYIFTSESIKPVSYQVDRSETMSDHFPVIATFDF